MALLIPPDLALSQLDTPGERLVVQALQAVPGDWIVIPNWKGRDGSRNLQADVILIHPRMGVIDIEVKDWIPKVVKGKWHRQGRAGVVHEQSGPDIQARKNAAGIRKTLQEASINFLGRDVEYAVWFPNARSKTTIYGTGLSHEQVLTSDDLEDPQEALDRLTSWSRKTSRLDDNLIQAIIATLAPDADFEWNREGIAALARDQMRSIASHQIDALRSLRENRRVAVHGAAGTGKTQLGIAWARDAARAGEESRILLTCFNEPLAARIAAQTASLENIEVEPVLPLFERLLTEAGRPPDGDKDADPGYYWNVAIPSGMTRDFHRIEERYDIIIVDEAQDFSPAWFGFLEALLDPNGHRGFMILYDEAQAIFSRGFHPPQSGDGWALAGLTRNCRNAAEIAQLLFKKLGGAQPVGAAPAALGCGFRSHSGTAADLVKEVRSVLDQMREQGRDPRSIIVQTNSKKARSSLLAHEDLGLVGWEQWSNAEDPNKVLCETVHRLKGLESDTAILAFDSHPSDRLIYVACSRAISELSIVGVAETRVRLGFKPVSIP
jgi:hypothetical protein